MNAEPNTIETKWWLAINGSSCSPSPCALPAAPNVVPTPELLLGFQTQEEQLKELNTIMTAPIGKVQKRLKEIIDDKSIIKIYPKEKRQPPSGETIWLLGS